MIFNAGSIEATLDLDVDPFQRGLAWARAEGKRFAGETYKATLDADTTMAARGANNARRSLERAEGTYRASFEVSGLREAAAEAAGLQAALSGVSGDAGAANAAGVVTRTRRGIMALLPALAIAATALVPIGAASVQVLGLLNNMTFAIMAAGTLILAFQGVGDALKAVNEAALNPTAENLEKMHATMSALSPAGRAFVYQLRDMRDELDMLRTAASEGFFGGGGNAAFDRIEAGMPRLDGLIYELSDTLGGQVNAATRGLDTRRWRTFLGFLESEARPGLKALTQSLGNVAGGFAGMWLAFDPLNDDFSRWLVDVTGRFDDWARALPDNQSFIDFVAYVRDVGPEVGEFLGAWGEALLDVAIAAAPLGGVTLDVLTAVADVISFIAEQPFGDTILLGAAAFYALNRAMAITNGLATRMGVQGGGAGLIGAVTGLGGKGVGGLKGFTRDLGIMATTAATAGSRTERELNRSREAAGRLRSTFANFGKGAAAAGGILAVASGVTDELGLTNTAMMGMVGAVAGPWGAAIGAAVGFFMDFTSAGDDANDTLGRIQDTIANLDYTGLTRELDLLGEQTDAAVEKGERYTGWLKAIPVAGTYLSAWSEKHWNGEEDRLRAAEAAAEAVRDKYAQLAGELTGAPTLDLGPFGQTTLADVESVEAALRSAGPALAAFNITGEDIAEMDSYSIKLLGMRIEAFNTHADSSKGRTEAFAQSVTDLGNEALRTAESADAMAAALEALLSPDLDLEAATDRWRTALQELEKTLKAGAGFEGYSKAALANRDATRSYAEDSMARLTALANVSTTTERDMANAVAATRREFIESGIAAGFSRKEISARADALGLTPKLVRTVFEAAGITEADLKARRLRNAYNELPKDVRSVIRTEGVPKTMDAVDRLVEKYELTEKQRQALVTLRDQATGPLANVLNWLNRVDGQTATVTTYHDYVTRNRVYGGSAGPARFATGGGVYGPGTGTSDSIPAWLSHGEHVWTAREVANAGGHAVLEAMRAQYRYATGGPVLNRAQLTAAAATRKLAASRPDLAPDVLARLGDRIVDAIERNRGLSVTVTSREEIEQALRLLEEALAGVED